MNVQPGPVGRVLPTGQAICNDCNETLSAMVKIPTKPIHYSAENHVECYFCGDLFAGPTTQADLEAPPSELPDPS